MPVTGGQSTKLPAVQCAWSLNALLNNSVALMAATETMLNQLPRHIHLHTARQAAFQQI